MPAPSLLRPEHETWFRNRSEPRDVPQWLLNAQARVVADAHRYVSKAVRERALVYLSPRGHWQLDMLFHGLSRMDTDEALKRIEWCRGLPSYAHRVARINLKAAELYFRWLRLCEHRAENARWRSAMDAEA